jgi:predicted dehydrogenase
MNALKEKLFGWQSTVVETFRQELIDFIALSRDGEPGRIADGYAGLQAVAIANAIYTSSVERREVTISTS